MTDIESSPSNDQARHEYCRNQVQTISRVQILERKKATGKLIKDANSVKDHLASFHSFQKFSRNGLSVYLESGFGGQLSSPIKHYIKALLQLNMEGAYRSEWPMEEKVKHREMVAAEARYILVRKNPTECDTPQTDSNLPWIPWRGNGDPLVGFVQYRFVLEEDVPVLYVYELQLEPSAQGKGLGKFLMQLIERIALKNHMGAVMLTVQKSNAPAMTFYMDTLRYVISTTSPSRVNPIIGAEKSYEILCRTLSPEAKAKLEVSALATDLSTPSESNEMIKTSFWC